MVRGAKAMARSGCAEIDLDLTTLRLGARVQMLCDRRTKPNCDG